MANADIASVVERVAREVAYQDGNPYRIRAYLHLARRVAGHPVGVSEILLSRGPVRLREALGVGTHLGALIEEIVYGSCADPAGNRPSDGAPGALPVRLWLTVDARYRSLSASGQLRRIAPRRFNPDEKAWLPLMEVDLAGWEIRAAFSNTERAHDLARVSDWVVIVAEKEKRVARATVVTERQGRSRGLRVVRGLERACRDYYRRMLAPLRPPGRRRTNSGHLAA
jgi:hypothetical protein